VPPGYVFELTARGVLPCRGAAWAPSARSPADPGGGAVLQVSQLVLLDLPLDVLATLLPRSWPRTALSMSHLRRRPAAPLWVRAWPELPPASKAALVPALRRGRAEPVRYLPATTAPCSRVPVPGSSGCALPPEFPPRARATSCSRDTCFPPRTPSPPPPASHSPAPRRAHRPSWRICEIRTRPATPTCGLSPAYHQHVAFHFPCSPTPPRSLPVVTLIGGKASPLSPAPHWGRSHHPHRRSLR